MIFFASEGSEKITEIFFDLPWKKILGDIPSSKSLKVLILKENLRYLNISGTK